MADILRLVDLQDVLNEIANQYSAHDEIVPTWLSLSDIPAVPVYTRCPCCNNVYCLQSYNIGGKVVPDYRDQWRYEE